MRVETGIYKGRQVSMVNDPRTRYTTSMVKQSIVNMVDFDGKICADLCAGSGAVGIEMLSNGAEKVFFVDVSSKAVKTITENLKNIGVESEKYEILKLDIRRFMEKAVKFDIVFSDPPYNLGIVKELLTNVYKILKDDGLFVLQSSPQELKESLKYLKNLQILKEKSYGDTILTIYKPK